MAISFAPKDAGEGLKNDYRGQIVKAACERWVSKPGMPVVPAVHLTILDEAGESDEAYWSAGSIDVIVPTDDSEEFDAAPGKSSVKINKNSNTMVFFRELMNCAADKGAVEAKLASGKITELLGLDLHWKRQAKAGFTAKDGKVVKDSEVLVPVKIFNEADWLAGKATSAAAGKANGAGAGNGAVDEELKSLVEATLVNAIKEAGGKLAKKAVSQAVFKAFADDPARKQKALSLALTESFLAGSESWKYDKKELAAV